MQKKVRIRIFDIQWDVDDEGDLGDIMKDLPKEAFHDFVCDDDLNEFELNDEIGEQVSEWLSNAFGFYHYGFECEVI